MAQEMKKKPVETVERSYFMLLASYWLARCGVNRNEKSSLPPSALNTKKWNEAYDFFYDAVGDGRSLSQFRNSMKNARDSFDILFDNGRAGWVDAEGRRPTLSDRLRSVHDEWRDRSSEELEAVVLGLQSGMPNVFEGDSSSPVAKTEGGEKVYVSTRRERDPELRKQAIIQHGLDCMACGFNFEQTYGELGEGFVEVHHVVPLSQSGKTDTDPKEDLVVLCANCHRMVHRKRETCLSLTELKAHLNKQKVLCS